MSSAPDPRFRALSLSSSIPHAGDWLLTLPSPSLGLHFLDLEFRTCLCYWLGISLSSDNAFCPLGSRSSDSLGDHSVACGGNGDRILRHNSLRDVLFTAAQSAALSPRREVPSIVPGSCSRPADLYLPYWSHGKPAAMDVTVISSLQDQRVSQAATSQGSALLYAEERKNIVHFEDCRRVGVSFFPLAVEVLGGWSQSAVSIISSLGQHLVSRRGSPTGQVIHHLLQKLCRSLEDERPYVALSLSPSSPRGGWHYLTILFYFVLLLLLLLLFYFSLFYFIFIFSVFCLFCQFSLLVPLFYFVLGFFLVFFSVPGLSL